MALTFDSNMTDGMLAKLNRHQVASYDNREAIDELDGLGVPATMFLPPHSAPISPANSTRARLRFTSPP